jgi:hypothetical protein
MKSKMANYGVARLENPDFPHCEKGVYQTREKNLLSDDITYIL